MRVTAFLFSLTLLLVLGFSIAYLIVGLRG
ncbi:MAG: hypothetical protein JWM86_816 [Thermoleophilia bacterium]|nr:hypothetical protein [Thermoleophilia bacterium]